METGLDAALNAVSAQIARETGHMPGLPAVPSTFGEALLKTEIAPRNRFRGMIWDSMAAQVRTSYSDAQARSEHLRAQADADHQEVLTRMATLSDLGDRMATLQQAAVRFGAKADIVETVQHHREHVPGTWRVEAETYHRPRVLLAKPVSTGCGKAITPAKPVSTAYSADLGDETGLRVLRVNFADNEVGCAYPDTTFREAWWTVARRAVQLRRELFAAMQRQRVSAFFAEMLETVLGYADRFYAVPSWADLQQTRPETGFEGVISDPTELSPVLKGYLRTVLMFAIQEEVHQNQTQWARAIAERHDVTLQAVLDAFRGAGLIAPGERATDYARFRARIEQEATQLAAEDYPRRGLDEVGFGTTIPRCAQPSDPSEGVEGG